MKSLFRSLLVLIALAFPLAEASAHATPVSYQPASNVVLPEVPDAVLIRLSERVDLRASSISVFAPDGSRVDTGTPVIDSANPRAFGVGIRDGGAGTYAVSWSVVSADDGHFTKGAYIFSVGQVTAAATAGGFQVIHRTTIPEATVIWIELVGQALLIGVLAFGILLWPGLRRELSATETERIRRRMLRMLFVGSALIVLGVVSYLLLRIHDLRLVQGSIYQEAFWSFLSTVTGLAALYRMICAIIFALIAGIFRKSILVGNSRRTVHWAFVVLLVISLLLRARVSHAAASDVYPLFSILVNAAHLLGKDLWIGTLAIFVVCPLPVLLNKKSASLLALGLTSLSKFLGYAFALGGITGAYIVWLHLKGPGNLALTQWGAQFLPLTLFGFLLLGLRLYHLFAVDPAALRVAEGKGASGEAQMVTTVPFTLAAEACTGIAVLFLSSILIITTPPVTQGNLFRQSIESQGVVINLAEYPGEQDQLLLSFDTTTQSPVVTLTNVEKGIGPIVAQVEERFPGGFILPSSQFVPSGTWKIDVTAQQQGGYDAVGSFTVRYPDDLLEATGHSSALGLVSGIAALLLFAAALWIVRLSAYRLRRVFSGESVVLPVVPRFIWPAAVLTIPAFAVLTATLSHDHRTFHRDCEMQGGYWHESVPTRGGIPTSTVPVLGCMVGTGMGQYHIVDARDFAHFMRPAQAQVTMEKSAEVFAVGTPATLTFTIRDPERKPITDLSLAHDRILHVIVVGQDLETFAHIHAEDAGPVSAESIASGEFTVTHAFPAAGRYLIAVDYTVRAQQFAQEFTVDVQGTPALPRPSPEEQTQNIFDGYAVTLEKPDIIRAMQLARLTYRIEKDGKPVTDLEPYLAAPMHVAVVRSDFRRFLHTHGEIRLPMWEQWFQPKRLPAGQHLHAPIPDRFGPQLDAYVLFPGSGTYMVFGEFRHGGKTITTKFLVQVAE